MAPNPDPSAQKPLNGRVCVVTSANSGVGFASAGALALQLSADYPKVDLLVNNAGVYLARKELTEDGFERTFAVNYLAAPSV